jgi:tRNA 2-selenouridine synthase
MLCIQRSACVSRRLLHVSVKPTVQSSIKSIVFTETDAQPPSLSRFSVICDVRSPCEYALDHVPGSVNMPVLDDDQRTIVGTMYKQQSASKAKNLGAALVSENVSRILRTHFWQYDNPEHHDVLVYCFRGGDRSSSLAYVLHKIGFNVSTIARGYKSFRAHVMSYNELKARKLKFHVISGFTGVGKSVILKRIAELGGQVLDLEEYAEHRGSVLGAEPASNYIQPSQKLFETRIWNALKDFDETKPVFIEAESSKVGKLCVPPVIHHGIREAVLGSTTIQLPVEERVKFIREQYCHLESNDGRLLNQLMPLKKLVGGELFSKWEDMISGQHWEELVVSLLVNHYDALYNRSIERTRRRTKVETLQLKSFSEEVVSDVAESILNNVIPIQGRTSTIREVEQPM